MKIKRILAITVAAAMMLALFPASAMAVDVDGSTYTLDSDDVVLNVSGTSTIQSNGSEYTNVQIICADGTNLTLDDVNINNSADGVAAVRLDDTNDDPLVEESFTINLEGDNTLTAGEFCAAVDVDGSEANGAVKVTIGGTGTLMAQGGTNAAGIGGEEANLFTVTITGGTIDATGGSRGAGIGGGDSAEDFTVNIEGGTITAQGGSDAAGIGGGDGVENFTVTITGGTITAQGGGDGAGIGGGYGATGGTITLSSGTIDATGGEGGAGIGYGAYGGYYDESGTEDDLVIDIKGTADVTAQGGNFSAGIGYGDYSDDGPMTINISESAVVTAMAGSSAAGIGSGDDYEDEYGAQDSVINISGGWVYAVGDEYGAGIGVGDDQGGVRLISRAASSVHTELILTT